MMETELILEDFQTHKQALMLLKGSNLTETKVFDLLAVHLFSRLVCGDVIVAKGMRGQTHQCPCGCGERILIGNTGIGNAKTWHGFPDMLIQHTAIKMILLEPDYNLSADTVDYQAEASIEEENEEPYYYSVVVKTRETDIYDIELSSQLVSQSVTNGFAQKSKVKLSNCLVPSIACTQDQMVIAMYDPDRDI